MVLSHVLIAEDDHDDYDLISYAIRDVSDQVKIERVRDGDALFDALIHSTPDLILLDILMPGKDGRQCLTELRADTRYRNIPVVIFSSLRSTEEVEFCFRGKANLFTIKPNTYLELSGLIKRILSLPWRPPYYATRAEFVLNPALIIP